MFEGDHLVVWLVQEEGGTYRDISVRLRLDKVGLLLNTYTYLGAHDPEKNEPVVLTKDQIIDAETVADQIYWGIAS